ncbi:MAG: sialate O-acetylesterase [Planctomycetota bacterium]
MQHRIQWSTRLILLVLTALFSGEVSADSADKKPVRVYILAGQSNMVGTGAVSSLGYLGEDPETAPLLKRILNADGKPRVCDRVWISSLNGKMRQPGGVGQGKLSVGYGLRRDDPTEPGDCIGPEYTFGITMEDNYDGPILLIKTAWGGHSLHVEYRPPSAGEFAMPAERVKKLRTKGEGVLAEKQAELKEFTGKYYRSMMAHVQRALDDIDTLVDNYDASAGYELAGFVWFQGWNDLVAADVYPPEKGSEQFALYSDLLCHFIRDVRVDLNAPGLPFVIGVVGINGNHAPGLYSGPANAKTRMERFRQAMTAPALLPEFKKTVVAVPTAVFWDDQLGALGMKQLKVRQMRANLLKKSKSGPNVDGSMTPAQIQTFMDQFNEEIFTPEDVALKDRASGTGGFVHYYGSAKFHAQAGQAFARGLLELNGQ